MPKVTQLSPQKNNPNRYNLYVDDTFFCGVDEETIAKFGIAVEEEFSDETLQEIFVASEGAKLHNRALDYLSYRPRSRQEMKDYLYGKVSDYEVENKSGVIESILNRLEELSYINDEEFVSWWIDQRTEHRKPKGFRRIKQELYKKGIDQKVIKKIWKEKGVDEEELVLKHKEVIERKYDLDDDKERKKAINYLRRRGFLWEDIKNVLK